MQLVKIFFIAINIVTFAVYGLDKYRAVHQKWRIPEATLLILAACGGSAGALLAMYAFHHKIRKPKFRIGVPVILIAQMLLLVLIMKSV